MLRPYTSKFGPDNFKQPSVIARILDVGPGSALVLFPFPSLAEARGGGAPRGAQTAALLRDTARAMTLPARLAALHRGVLTPAPGRAFRPGLRRLRACPSVSQLLAGGLCYPQAEPRRRPVHGLRGHTAGAAPAEDRDFPGAGHRDRPRISGAYPRSVPPSRRLMKAPLGGRDVRCIFPSREIVKIVRKKIFAGTGGLRVTALTGRYFRPCYRRRHE